MNQPERVILASIGHNTQLRYVSCCLHRLLPFTRHHSKNAPHLAEPQLLPRNIPQVVLDLIPLDPNRMTVSGHVGLAAENAPPDSVVAYPISLPTSERLTQKMIEHHRRTRVSASQLNKYKRNVETLERQIFIGRDDDDEEEVFRILSYTPFPEKIFYLLFQDDDEVIAFPCETVYDMINSSQLVHT